MRNFSFLQSLKKKSAERKELTKKIIYAQDAKTKAKDSFNAHHVAFEKWK